MNRKTLTLILLFVLALCPLCFGQTETERGNYDLIFEGSTIGTLELRVLDLGNDGFRITSEASYTMSGRDIVYSATLSLAKSSQADKYSINMQQDSYKQSLVYTVDNQTVRVRFTPAGKPGQNWAVDAPEGNWVFFDNNSMAGFYLFSLLASPSMETVRGNTFLAPARKFASYEIQSKGPAVTMINGKPVQCDLYTLTIEGTINYQLFISGTKLLEVKQEGNELSIRSRDN